MASGVNKVILVGNLGQKPEMRYTKDQQPIANFSIATSESWKDKSSGDMMERTEWHNVTFFGRIAEVVERYLDKGSKVYVEGRLQTDKWEDENGNKRSATKIIGSNMQMLDSKGGSQSNESFDQSQPASQPAQSQDSQISEEDIPF
tara:strand:+ start:2466 stop:2903 length:438 start_codon:yes stop_codon:yes gene_type:complete